MLDTTKAVPELNKDAETGRASNKKNPSMHGTMVLVYLRLEKRELLRILLSNHF